MRRATALVGLICLVRFHAVTVHAQNLVANGGFETGDFTGWTTNAGNSSGTVVNGPQLYGFFCAYFSEIIYEGDEGTEDQLYQTISTHPGTNYFFSFWANGERDSSLGANWGSLALLTNSIYYTGYSPLSPGWVNFQFLVQATGPNTELTFSFRENPGASPPPSITYLDGVSVVALNNYNKVVPGLVNQTNVAMAFAGIPNSSYALDRTFNLQAPVQWIPLETNAADANGNLVITNTAVTTTNNFWRFRAVP